MLDKLKEYLDRAKKHLNTTDIILIIVVLILMLIALSLLIRNYAITKKADNSKSANTVVANNTTNNTTYTVPQTETEIVKDLSKKNERDRMEYYCGEYFKHLQKNEIEAAYNLLYVDFKEKYFPTLEEYTEYIKKTYPQNFALKYDDITRQGNIYVLDLVILDVFGDENSEKRQRVVLKENTYNNFVLSFQVI